ncbi:unnamed protein product [Gongylonema pulchrum]|uniref:Kinase n=1 Tax=Gongylonema pulchrum TaxID=637853 RepID=A0A183E1W0_9BILA|nr:unnamed protein product [Gongylonema pulchrum]
MAVTALPLDCWLKERLKNWVQLSGHEGTIVPATDHTLWKKRTGSDYNEGDAYRSLMNDPALDGFVARYYREVKYKNESFIEIEDLTALFDNPAIMDIKMGTRLVIPYFTITVSWLISYRQRFCATVVLASNTSSG